MSNNQPFVIQFSSLDDFLAEALEQEVIRVWPCTFGVGNPQYGIRRTHCVCLQTIDAAQMAVLTVYLFVGRYEELHGKPFGPNAERIQAVVEGFMETAVNRVRDTIYKHTPTPQIRPGRIHTSLKTEDIQAVLWVGFEPAYQEQREAR